MSRAECPKVDNGRADRRPVQGRREDGGGVFAGGYICVGWDEVGDLREYDSKEPFRAAFPSIPELRQCGLGVVTR
jgi:hypothetical protein